jgi:type 2 lantibiotic biosynthesis protein LanM
MRASLTTLSQEVDRAMRRSHQLNEPQTAASRERLLAAAREVGDQLLALAHHGDSDAAWVGLTLVNARQWSLRSLATDLYSGHAGCALFLAYLGAVADDECYTALARAAVTTMCRQSEDEQTRNRSIGGFSGLGGMVYTLAHLGVLWNQSALFTQAEAIVARLPALIECDERLDILAGAAGCIVGLLSLYRCAPSDETLAAVLQCGDRLLATARSMPQGIGWATLGPTPLAGFSHGAAGIALALLELTAITGVERFYTTALGAIDYERSLFRSEAGNWLDLRPAESPDQQTNAAQAKFMTAWCNGAAGIGLARLHGLRHLDDAAARAEIAVALETTLATGFGRNHSLCHGDLGNLETLLVASQVLDDPRWPAQVNRLAAMILESIECDGWICANPLGVETPGLMTGLAGIGYELLRLAEPARVPSVLLLEPPLAG